MCARGRLLRGATLLLLAAGAYGARDGEQRAARVGRSPEAAGMPPPAAAADGGAPSGETPATRRKRKLSLARKADDVGAGARPAGPSDAGARAHDAAVGVQHTKCARTAGPAGDKPAAPSPRAVSAGGAAPSSTRPAPQMSLSRVWFADAGAAPTSAPAEDVGRQGMAACSAAGDGGAPRIDARDRGEEAGPARVGGARAEREEPRLDQGGAAPRGGVADGEGGARSWTCCVCNSRWTVISVKERQQHLEECLCLSYDAEPVHPGARAVRDALRPRSIPRERKPAPSRLDCPPLHPGAHTLHSNSETLNPPGA